jgi:hypothetical protein
MRFVEAYIALLRQQHHHRNCLVLSVAATASMEDTVLIDIFEAMEAYLKAQQALSAALKTGHMSLAQAKYSLKPGALSQLSYPGETAACAVVQATGSDPTELSLRSSMGPAGLSKQASGGSSRQPRPSDDTGRNSSKDKSKSHPSNPVAWFAPLPPPSLPAAQQSFQEALQQAVAAANSIYRLRHKLEGAGLCLEEAAAAAGAGDSPSAAAEAEHRQDACSKLECSSSAVMQLLADLKVAPV